ncbi:hypothetical protein JST99_05115 [Candidatus Dependentiae bacterium]|nr:hypothetical protein [Candidatus Dependentiae bacterium]MCC7415296.1 hypothetical protein [Campylobacterota bacterium]
MNKMNIVALLGLIATLPACDYCCSNKKVAAPVEEIAVVQEPAATDEAIEEILPVDAVVAVEEDAK